MSVMNEKLKQWERQLFSGNRQNQLQNYQMSRVNSLQINNRASKELWDRLVIKKESILVNEIRPDDYTERAYAQWISQIQQRSKVYYEEKGIQNLYLIYGFAQKDAKWPLLLMPVRIHEDNRLSMSEEILLNPVLYHEAREQYNVELEEPQVGQETLEQYYNKVKEVLGKEWTLSCDVVLTTLTFYKMGMYDDLTDHEEQIAEHPVLKAFLGDRSGLKTAEDKEEVPERFEVLDADSSQEQVIDYAAQGLSFVLQGPPGTGKSQTITNLIAQAMAQGKRVLFVSQKQAALEVVYEKLKETGLSSFCLPLQEECTSRQLIEELCEQLQEEPPKVTVEETYHRDMLRADEQELDAYAKELHEKIEPLGMSIYEAQARLLKLHVLPDVMGVLPDVMAMTQSALHQNIIKLKLYEHIVESMEPDIHDNPWFGVDVGRMEQSDTELIQEKMEQLAEGMRYLGKTMENINEEFQLQVPCNIQNISPMVELLQLSVKVEDVPVELLDLSDQDVLLKEAKKQAEKQNEYQNLHEELQQLFTVDYEEVDGEEALVQLKQAIGVVKGLLSGELTSNNNELISRLPSLKQAVEHYYSLLHQMLKLDKS